MTPPNQEVTISFRVSPEVEARIGQLAGYLGRSRSDVLRHAVAVFDTQLTLAYLQTTEAADELGDRLPEAQASAKRALRELSKAAYTPRPRSPIAEPTL